MWQLINAGIARDSCTFLRLPDSGPGVEGLVCYLIWGNTIMYSVIARGCTSVQFSYSSCFWPLSIYPSLPAMFTHEISPFLHLIVITCLNGCVHSHQTAQPPYLRFHGSASSRWHESSQSYPGASASHSCNEGGCVSISHSQCYDA